MPDNGGVGKGDFLSMRRYRRRVWAAILAGLALLTGGIFATRAFAYTVNNDLSAYGNVVLEYGSYALIGGDSVKVTSGGIYRTLNGQIIHIAQEQANVYTPAGTQDGQGNWGLMQGDMQGANANNGYLLIADPSESTNVSQWVTRLGGNLSYVEGYLQVNNQQIQTTDISNGHTYTYVPFSSIVTASGGKFGTTTWVPTGATYDGYPVYKGTYPIHESAPPQAVSVSVSGGSVVQGGNINFALTSNDYLWSGEALYHYDAVQVTDNSTGQSYWAVGSGNTDRSQMTAEQPGSGQNIVDNLSVSSSKLNLQPGTYTAKFWVADGVDRVSSTPATTTFTVVPSGGSTTDPTVSLSANPISLQTGQSSTLTATAANVPSNDYIQIVDQSGDGTLYGSNTWADDQLGETRLTVQATDNQAQTVTYMAELVNAITGQVDATGPTVQVTWGSPQPVNASITFNPTSSTTVSSGTSVPLSYTTSGWQSGDYVLIIPNGNNTSDTWSNNNDPNSSDSYAETEYPQNGASSQVQYTAYLFNSAGNIIATAQSGQITWTSTAPPTPGTISVSPAPETVQSGQPVTIQYTTTNWLSGDYVTVTPSGNGTNEWSNSHDTNANDQFTEIENPVNGNTTTVGYTLTLYNGAGVKQSQTTTQITWGSVKPSITFSANPTSLTSGGTSNLSYSVSNLANGDYVDVVGTGNGQDAWNASNLTSASWTYAETETPENGATVTESYTATVYNSSGQALSQATGSVTWTSVKPTISMLANPTKLVPGQPSTISYSVQNLQTGDYVNVVGTGGTDAWNVSKQAAANEQYTETESPASGQTTTVQYTATVYSSTGQALNSATVSAAWTNAWTGTVSLSASPQYLPTGSATKLTATGSTAIPSGYSLYIKDNSTGQVVSQSSNTTESASYTSYHPETDQFQAYVWDGYEQVGNPSSTVSVVWSTLSLSASPTMTPVNNGSTLTVTGQNVPSGDYLIIYDQTTGQVVGYSQSTPYSVTQTQSTPQTDSYLAYINSSATPNGAYATSNPVTVDWYSVTLTASPTRLPVNDTSTLTANAQNIPSGYVVDILDQTTNTVFASGQPGQTTIQALQTKSQVETDKYIAQVVQPNNPPIPGLTVPPSPPGSTATAYGFFSDGSDGGSENYLMITLTGQNLTSYMLLQDVTHPTPTSPPGGGLVLSPYNGTSITMDFEIGNAAQIGDKINVYYKDTSGQWYVTTLNWTGVQSNGGIYGAPEWNNDDNSLPIPPTGAIQAGGTTYFPYWTFQQMPSYVPTSLFPNQAVTSGNGIGGFWTEGSQNVPNGTAFFESTFNLPSAQQVTVSVPNGIDDYEQIYLDGKPTLQIGTSFISGLSSGVPRTNSVTLTLPTGLHQVVIEAQNNDGFGTAPNNPASASAQVVGQSGQVLVSNAASSWMTTGYVTQLPAGWFSGAIGTYNFTEYILQEGQSNPIYQQQSYTVTTTAANVDAQSPPLAVSWYNPILAPDNFNLQALPRNVTYPAQTQFKVTFDQSDINFVNQEMSGSGKIVIRAVQTWQEVASGTWTPNTQGTSTAIPYKPVGGTNLQYVAFLVDPNKNVPVAVSNQVTVTDTGLGITGNSYTTTSCSAQGNGTEIFNTYTNGTLTSSKTVPLTMQNLEVDGIFNATQQLHNDLGTVIHLPVTNAQVGYGPIPLRVQAPFAFAIQFANAQPTTVTATLHVIENDAVDMNGDTSWTVKMHPVTNLPYGFWQGETIMPKLPDGDHISIQITATDDCGSVSTPTGVAPYDDFVTTNGRPQWYFVQPSSP